METNVKITELKKVKKLGEGGQGEVFHVKRGRKDYALKIYNGQSATQDQRDIISALVASGIPGKSCYDKFIWPQALVSMPDNKQFGYLMPLIDMGKYITLADIGAGRVPHPGFGVLTEAGRQLAEAFRLLHIEGYCCRDISANNFLFSPKNGDVAICDNDNVVVDKQHVGGILGTPQFIAPEVVLGSVRPSTVTDFHSLAVLIFVMLCGGNPLHGVREFNVRIFDSMAAQEIYGRNPVFVFDPNDNSNRLPDEPGYRQVAMRWKVLPTEIRQMFVRAFTSGLKSPEARVTDVEWKNALARMLGQRHICSCGAENFWDSHLKTQLPCWHKGCSVAFPRKLYVQGKTTVALLAKPGQQLTSLHFGEKSSATVIGEMEKHPSDASLVLLRNTTGATWNATLGNQQILVHTEKAIPLHPGIQIQAGSHELTVCP